MIPIIPGVHRSLGVHISFVRSVTMDKWKDEEIKRMQLGGNKKCLEFFKTQPDWREGLTIQEKYDSLVPFILTASEFARMYKEKLTCEVEGRPFIPSDVKQRLSTPPPKRSRDASQQSLSSLAQGNKFNQASSVSQKEKNEDYFNKLGSSNSLKSDAIKPSEGGKYVGFGSSYNAGPSNSSSSDDPLAALSKGFSMFASVASSVASSAVSAAETVGKRVNESGYFSLD
jgi:ADP-ribosylation factor GTPase-activating protein 1